ncbi:hypothetical protein [Pseudomonas sp. NBRC 111124]|uniref:hypothetical protein n=1 Tax=Pseudomonas sp. NBRC 111124 TaxID=1661039 RepID=UPI0012E3114A|nr:hypothetical protein [Pseudomonas sp. NBRC 111124]
MNTRNPFISVLIFPIAPISAIFLTHFLCSELWRASYYVPGEDGGEAEPAMALIGIPFLLIAAVGPLAQLRLQRRRAPTIPLRRLPALCVITSITVPKTNDAGSTLRRAQSSPSSRMTAYSADLASKPTPGMSGSPT